MWSLEDKRLCGRRGRPLQMSQRLRRLHLGPVIPVLLQVIARLRLPSSQLTINQILGRPQLRRQTVEQTSQVPYLRLRPPRGAPRRPR